MKYTKLEQKILKQIMIKHTKIGLLNNPIILPVDCFFTDMLKVKIEFQNKGKKTIILTNKNITKYINKSVLYETCHK